MIPNPDEILRMLTSNWGASSDDSTPKDDVLEFMLRAYLISMNSAFRYWSGWTKLYGSYYPEVGRYLSTISSDPGEREEARQSLLNNLSACIREMSDLSDQEFRRLQAELEEVSGKVWPMDEQDEAGTYWRRWNVKP